MKLETLDQIKQWRDIKTEYPEHQNTGVRITNGDIRGFPVEFGGTTISLYAGKRWARLVSWQMGSIYQSKGIEKEMFDLVKEAIEWARKDEREKVLKELEESK